jgi:hypothetical protein
VTEADSLFQWKLDFASGSSSWVLGTSEKDERKGWISTIINAFLPPGAKPAKPPEGTDAASLAVAATAAAAAAAATADVPGSPLVHMMPSYGRSSVDLDHIGHSGRSSSDGSAAGGPPPASAPLPMLPGAHSAPSARRIVLSGGQAVLTSEPVNRSQAPPPTPAPSQRHLDLGGSAKTAPLPTLTLTLPSQASQAPKYSWLKALFQYPLPDQMQGPGGSSGSASASSGAQRPGDARGGGGFGGLGTVYEEHSSPGGGHKPAANSRYQPEGLGPATQSLELLIERYDPSLVTEALAEQFER